MIEAIQNLYYAEDLKGEAFLRPLKKFHGFSIEEISSDKLKQLVQKIICIVKGVFAYPLFGLLAFIGMGIKCMHIPEMRQHNQKQKEQVIQICQLVTSALNASVSIKDSPPEGYRQELLGQSSYYEINEDPFLPEMLTRRIDACTALYRKAYLVAKEINAKNMIGLEVRYHV